MFGMLFERRQMFFQELFFRPGHKAGSREIPLRYIKVNYFL